MCVILFLSKVIKNWGTYDVKSVLFFVLLLQSLIQGIFSVVGLAQYYCVVDFLRHFPLLLYVRILYFHNPALCHSRVNIGNIIAELPNQAFILIPETPHTVTRTLTFNWINIVLCLLWLTSSMTIMATASKIKALRWPWIFCSISISALDMIATVTFINDSFYTRTLNDLVDYIGGTLSGAGNVELNTAWASWIMVMIYSRFIIFFTINILFIILVVIDTNAQRIRENTIVKMEQPTQTDLLQMTTVKDEDECTERIVVPRAGMNKSFTQMKRNLLIRKRSNVTEQGTATESALPGTSSRPPSPLRPEPDKKRSVNFPENLLSLPQRLENLIAEQQKRLDRAIIDTAGRQSPTRISQSLPQLSSRNEELAQAGEELHTRRGRRRSTVAELQGQLPWAYVEGSSNRMRDQLPPDEDLPPVPLPDYAALPSFRKASVHRAASSVSSIRPIKEKRKSNLRRKWSSVSTDE